MDDGCFPELSVAMETCEDCGFEIPEDAALGMCPVCLIGTVSAIKTTPDENDGSERIPGYKLVRQIGEGGFAVVYEAKQLKPVRRRVALKILKPEVSSPQVLARFDAESQALAMMGHPNIASIYDAGRTIHGEPWFAMEFVEGASIVEFSRSGNLPLTENLALFRRVCEAVQHAHLKGILHRDLKPSNILVAEIDGHPVPKVIDFGIARALDVSLTSQPLFTEFRQIVGTPGYMSPEQATLDDAPVDGRSDIYSLGILFFEILTGVHPFAAGAEERPEFSELLRRVREDDPPPLSRFSPEFRGEIEWVIAKAIAKDPSDRYDSAGTFARELQCLIGNRPVEAAAPSRRYLFRKFVQRHQSAVIAGCLILITLLAGIAVSTGLFLKADRLSADLRDREIDLRSEFRDSDYQLGLQMAARRRPGDAIAYFSRALRTDPRHAASASCLLSLLANQKFTKSVYPSQPFHEDIKESRFPIVLANGRSVVSLSSNPARLVRWNLEAGTSELFPLEFSEPVIALLSAGAESEFVILTRRSGEVRSIESPEESIHRFSVAMPITSYTYASNSPMIVLGCEDGTVCVYDTKLGVEVAKTSVSDAPITALDTAREGRLIGFGTGKGEVGTWGIDLDFQSRNRSTHTSRITALTFAESGTHLSSGDESGLAFLWRARQMLKMAGPIYHGDSVSLLKINSSFRRLVSGSHDGYARIWDMRDGALIPPVQPHRSPVIFGEATSDSNEYITAGEAGSIRIWSVGDGSGEAFPGAAQSSSIGMSYSRQFLVTISDKRRRLAIHEMDRLPGWIRRIDPGSSVDESTTFGVISPSLLLSESGDIEVKQINPVTLRARNGESMYSLKSTQPIKSWTMKPCGSQVVALTEGGRLLLWDPRSGEETSSTIRLSRTDLKGVRFSGRTHEIEFLFDDGGLGSFEIPPADPVLPPWFLEFAEKMGGKKLSDDGVIRAAESASLSSIRTTFPITELSKELGETVAVNYAGWLTSSRERRTSGPTSSVTLNAYVESLLATREPGLVREALRLDPGNPEGVEILKSNTMVR